MLLGYSYANEDPPQAQRAPGESGPEPGNVCAERDHVRERLPARRSVAWSKVEALQGFWDVLPCVNRPGDNNYVPLKPPLGLGSAP